MTPFNSTPVVWIAFVNRGEAESLAERISSFADARVLDTIDLNDAAFLHEIGMHQSAWLVLDESQGSNEALQALCRQASETHEFFRCMCVGLESQEGWPAGSVFLSPNTLSTTVIDRLRNESHVLRIMSSRIRHMRRLQNR